MSKHFSELKFEIIQVDNQDYFEQNGSTVDMVVQNIIRHKEEACGDVETGACQTWIQSSYVWSPMMQAQQICRWNAILFQM